MRVRCPKTTLGPPESTQSGVETPAFFLVKRKKNVKKNVKKFVPEKRKKMSDPVCVYNC